MARFKIVRLEFRSPLHLGRGLGEAYDTAEKTLHSDTLSGALTSAFCMLCPDKDPLIFMKSFKVSSAFPFVDEHFFMPKPLTRVNLSFSEGDGYEQKKKIKKIEYFEIPLWQHLISGSKIVVSENNLSSGGRFLFNKENIGVEPFKDELQQRVTVSRDRGDSKPYFVDRRHFSEKAGLFFFLDTDDNNVLLIRKILDYLKDIGFGTDKSVGNGQFSHEISSIDLETNNNYPKQMLISLACPSKDEISRDILKGGSYLLTRRGGFIAGTSLNRFRHLRKKSVYMFQEGSIFPIGNFEGKIVNVRPEWNDSSLHQVYRDGRSFLIPVNI
ncbi:MAG TPA: type III-A CRISPR-associated RAMP protein Csm4 [Prolixibacteraceae bacterium]|jgi:CRISPR type III-A-associated RAMP protein Csm4|nr:type III-A CRISPR-associated RAMP protein Csm4 [Prolixibacteraceae bacterium]HOS91586.1 type III-A CRISPR-associated RAMP protein Csm4 [Prolixibacteraceae bacterium]HQJ86833.1 type III-A CRISPR-associated RAMP protein Csm4 [Prolixibacteraceae bacterium]